MHHLPVRTLSRKTRCTLQKQKQGQGHRATCTYQITPLAPGTIRGKIGCTQVPAFTRTAGAILMIGLLFVSARVVRNLLTGRAPGALHTQETVDTRRALGGNAGIQPDPA